MEYQKIVGEINKQLYKATEIMPAWLFRCFKKNPNYWRDFVLDKYTSKEIIKQLKIDIIDYSTWKEMKDLVIFVYDPKNKISDKSEFDELSGVSENGGVRYTVHVVISN